MLARRTILMKLPETLHFTSRKTQCHKFIWVDKKRWHLLQVEELKANDDVLTYTLEDHRAGKKLEEDLFAFEPPDGVQVIDRRPTGAHRGE